MREADTLENLEKGLKKLAASVDRRFDVTERRFDAAAAAAKTESAAISHMFGDLRQAIFDRTEVLRTEMNQRFATIDQRFATIDQRFDRLESMLGRVLAARPTRPPSRRGR